MPAAEQDGPWSRRRLLAVAATIVATALVALGGLVIAVVEAATSSGTSNLEANSAGVEDTASGPDRRDAIAAAGMLQVSAQDARSGTPSLTSAGTIAVPIATTLGAAEVPTGFPRTPEGAVGQLAAIATTVLDAMSIEETTAVYAAWSADGAPPVDTWELARAVQGFLGSAAGQYTDRTTTQVHATPVAGQIKGTDGPDWVVACVLLDVRATVVTEARTAWGHCARMQWQTGRWVIGAGAAPAEAPSTWPGTDLAAKAGWLDWRDDDGRR
ncbi:MAG: hypothetical protein KQH57_11635 [Actinomycetales bacterium]|nr:hypothetical protein [Actinomycetales bacterium]